MLFPYKQTFTHSRKKSQKIVGFSDIKFYMFYFANPTQKVFFKTVWRQNNRSFSESVRWHSQYPWERSMAKIDKISITAYYNYKQWFIIILGINDEYPVVLITLRPCYKVIYGSNIIILCELFPLQGRCGVKYWIH